MKYYSTNNKDIKYTFSEAVSLGMPKDNGLFMPENIPALSKNFIEKIDNFNNYEISFEIARLFVDEEIPNKALFDIIQESINFPVPLINIYDNVFSLELFHGPTLAFKDFGARFISKIMNYFEKNNKKKLNILTATSGDTGSAVANGFKDINNINVIILYPSGKISNIQEKQIATLENNIYSLEVDGTFDDCQALVKKAFSDNEINNSIRLTSANSINIARLIPQIFYYFFAYKQIKNKENIIISVPSGNLGNLTAGLIAKKMGLPIKKFIAATNINKILPDYLKNGIFEPHDTILTISNAMDVGNPSNFYRILNLYDNDIENIRNDIIGFFSTDEETKNEIKEIFDKYGYILDPHGAVGLNCLKKYINSSNNNDDNYIFLETAHPAKFLEIVEPLINKKIKMPEKLEFLLNKEKKSKKISKNYEEFKSFLLNNKNFY